jgi:hypothetical protein
MNEMWLVVIVGIILGAICLGLWLVIRAEKIRHESKNKDQ